MTRLTLLLLLLIAPATLADEDAGLRLLREARRAVEAGDVNGARELLDQARTEWPGSPLVAHELADLHVDQDAWDAALVEYLKGAREPFAARSAFNSGVVRFRAAEEQLAAAGVPVDPAGLGQVADPGPLIAAIDAAMPRLREARRDFADALRAAPDEAARDSVAAITRRLDELQQMRDELEEMEPPESDEQQDDSQDQDDQENQDEQQDQQDGQDQDDQQPPPPQPQPQPREPRELTPQQVQQLLEKLDELEEQARRIEAIKRQAQRRMVEKDW